MNPKDSSYLLRDDVYKHVQRDWPGYGDDERQLISRLLARWVRGTSCTKYGCHLCHYTDYSVSDLGWLLAFQYVQVVFWSLFLSKKLFCFFTGTIVSHSSRQVAAPILICHLFLSPSHICSLSHPRAGANQHSETELVSTCHTMNLLHFHARLYSFSCKPTWLCSGTSWKWFFEISKFVFLSVQKEVAHACQPPIKKSSSKYVNIEDLR